MKRKHLISLIIALAVAAIIATVCIVIGTVGESKTDGGDNPPPNNDWNTLYDVISIARAIEIANSTDDKNPTDRYYVVGTIVNVSNPTYGEMTISDGTNEIYVYGTYSADGSIGYADFTDKPVKGDTVLIYCTLNKYNDNPQVKNARLIDFKKADKGELDASQYAKMSILDARNAKIGEKVSVTGVVARITYANGHKPNGVYLVDGTNSIYVYDTDIAGQVSIGNKVTVLGSKTYWVLDTEQSNANKFGYKGCCQIEDATLYENDKATNGIDFSWCTEKTVKEILNTPFTENVTTTIFKTTALVKKVPGNGFTNYYFNDIDGVTGTYTYTQCNGSDFTWLDEFDGKICTVYLSIINAKSSAGGCVWRLVPISVVDENFTFDLSNTPEHVVEYYGIDQFLSTYTGNPLLELVTSVSSELLGFENATLSYTSSNTDVVFFTEDEGKTVLNCGANGTSTVTITATYGDYTHSKSIEINVEIPVESEGITVKEAINTTVGEAVKVEGIIGPSVVNQSGFYLIDETGAIAVKIPETEFEGLAIGQKVVIEGTVSITKNGGGQLCIDNASIVANYYGKHDYSTSSFITNTTFEEVIAILDSPAATTQVYVITATVKLVETQFYSNIYLTNGSKDLLLYCNKASQYGFLNDYAGQKVTVELALCDWNSKGLKGAVLSIITDDGKIYNELNFKTN